MFAHLQRCVEPLAHTHTHTKPLAMLHNSCTALADSRSFLISLKFEGGILLSPLWRPWTRIISSFSPPKGKVMLYCKMESVGYGGGRRIYRKAPWLKNKRVEVKGDQCIQTWPLASSLAGGARCVSLTQSSLSTRVKAFRGEWQRALILIDRNFVATLPVWQPWS